MGGEKGRGVGEKSPKALASTGSPPRTTNLVGGRRGEQVILEKEALQAEGDILYIRAETFCFKGERGGNSRKGDWERGYGGRKNARAQKKEVSSVGGPLPLDRTSRESGEARKARGRNARKRHRKRGKGRFLP